MNRLHRQSLLLRRVFEDVGEPRQLVGTSLTRFSQLRRRRQTVELHFSSSPSGGEGGFLGGDLAPGDVEFGLASGAVQMDGSWRRRREIGSRQTPQVHVLRREKRAEILVLSLAMSVHERPVVFSAYQARVSRLYDLAEL